MIMIIMVTIIIDDANMIMNNNAYYFCVLVMNVFCDELLFLQNTQWFRIMNVKYHDDYFACRKHDTN